ncbi:FMN-binding domain-containing protein [Geodermatophilus telluris]|uniref:FMN-binding domain-containing protein n=1 Tax=Geodermatophilus telluris TaxID=1190417 RepID=A0A1G6QA75_9ACTN|nr:FMN-binding domain-containing protein [Geodermatophilus telluris]
MVSGVRRIVLWLASTVTGVVLLFQYPTSTSSAPEAATVVAASPAGTTTGTDGATTVTGPAVDTRYGPVQVQVTVSGGVITDVEVVEYPDGDRRDQQINSRAVPQLVQETLDAQSADVDMVSGATYTSEGYAESLQAALDEAGL